MNVTGADVVSIILEYHTSGLEVPVALGRDEVIALLEWRGGWDDVLEHVRVLEHVS